MKTRPLPLHLALPQKLFTLLALTAVLCGCPAGKPDTNAPAVTTDAKTVVIRGSNTFGEELAPALIAEFQKRDTTTKFDLETKATGYGMAALRIGKCDIAAASRPAIAADLDLAKETNLEMSEYVIGSYSIALIVNANNPVTNLTKDQVREIFTGKIKNWKDVGGPDAEIHLFIRDPISGTHLGFKEIAMNNEDYAPHPKLATSYSGITIQVATDPLAIGYTGLHQAKTPGVKALNIDGIEATEASVHAGKYPYARLLRLYTNKAKESAPTKSFIDFVLSARGQEILQQTGFSTKP